MRHVLILVVLAACGGKQPTPVARTPTQTGTKSAPAPTVAGDPWTAADGSTPSAPATPALNVCANHPDEFGPYLLTAAQAAARFGAQAKTYKDAASSKAQPVEVCGVAASLQWLVGTTCADGSRAFARGEAASRSRTGNVGPGGRCGSIVDRYVAKCPEAEYEVFVDMYMCGPSDQF